MSIGVSVSLASDRPALARAALGLLARARVRHAIDIETYDRHKDKLRQELTLLEIDRHADMLEKFDVEGILAFAERVLPRAADLWVQASPAENNLASPSTPGWNQVQSFLRQMAQLRDNAGWVA